MPNTYTGNAAQFHSTSQRVGVGEKTALLTLSAWQVSKTNGVLRWQAGISLTAPFSYFTEPTRRPVMDAVTTDVKVTFSRHQTATLERGVRDTPRTEDSIYAPWNLNHLTPRKSSSPGHDDEEEEEEEEEDDDGVHQRLLRQAVVRHASKQA